MKTKTFKWNWSSGKVLLLGMLMAVICFLPFLLSEQGFFVYFGDYNMQQLPFYTLVHRAIREGNLFLSLTTDLGSSIYSNYSFYLLGSPFFWITMLFPEAALPYLMPILLMLKLGLAAMFAFLFMRRHVAKPQTACIGALLYAFCGFQIMNIVFNHFLDVTVFFPLYLILLENLLDQKKRGWFALGTAFMVLLNYYFFVGQAFFIMLYVFIRYILPNKGCKLKERIGIVVRVLVEGGIGVLAASAFWLPSILSIMGTSRATEFVFGANAVYYSKWELYAGLLKSLFLPPDLIQETTLFSTPNPLIQSPICNPGS